MHDAMLLDITNTTNSYVCLIKNCKAEFSERPAVWGFMSSRMFSGCHIWSRTQKRPTNPPVSPLSFHLADQ